MAYQYLGINTSKKNRVNWRQILKEIEKAFEYFNNENVKPTLRTLFYRLVSQQLIPNTRSAYNVFSRQFVQARKDGSFAWDCIEDKTRTQIGELYDFSPKDDVLDKTEEILDEKLRTFSKETLPSLNQQLLNHFSVFPSDLIDFRVMKWAGQPTVCTFWIEKEALVSTLENWTKNYDVPIRTMRGYDSWTDIYRNARELKSFLRRGHEKVVIYYLGDLDPSGVDIDRFLKETIDYFGQPKELDFDVSKVEFKRLAIVEDHVEKYGLPPRPQDAETLTKLNRDSRTKNYKRKYVVELDALLAYVPSEFRKIVEDAIIEVWDKEIFDDLKKKAKELSSEVDDLIDETIEKAKEKISE